MRFLSFPQLGPEKGIRWCRNHIDRLEKRGEFPRRVHLGSMTIAWAEHELDAYLAARLAQRDEAAATDAGTSELRPAAA